MSEKNDILVQVDHLKKYFPVKGVHGPGVQAVEDVSLFIRRGETLGLVGETGAGKTTTALSVLRLIAAPPGKIMGGEIWFEGEDMLQAKPARLREIRGEGTPAVVLAVYGNRSFGTAVAELASFVAGRGFVPVAAGAFVGEHSYSKIGRASCRERV